MSNSPIETQVLGESVRRLRQAKGLSQIELAARAKISLPTLKSIESGKAMPRIDSLQSVASALGEAIFALLRPVRVLKDVRFRAKKKLRTRNEILSEVSNWLENMLELEELIGGKRKDSQIEAVKREIEGIAEPIERARQAAALIRRAWGLDDEPIMNICGLFASHGLKIFSLPKESREFFGLSVGPSDGGPAIIVNTWERITVERWIFSASHELGHLILHQNAFDADQIEENEFEEKEADTFAAYFLMPDKAFEKELRALRGIDWGDAVLTLKRIFKVSWKTVIKRLQDKGVLDNSAWARFQSRLQFRYGHKAEFNREPFPASASIYVDDKVEPENLKRSDFPAHQLQLGSLVLEALGQGKITMSKAAKILGSDIKEIRELARDWKVGMGTSLVAEG